jgi:hypothetical protein
MLRRMPSCNQFLDVCGCFLERVKSSIHLIILNDVTFSLSQVCTFHTAFCSTNAHWPERNNLIEFIRATGSYVPSDGVSFASLGASGSDDEDSTPQQVLALPLGHSHRRANSSCFSWVSCSTLCACDGNGEFVQYLHCPIWLQSYAFTSCEGKEGESA